MLIVVGFTFVLNKSYASPIKGGKSLLFNNINNESFVSDSIEIEPAQPDSLPLDTNKVEKKIKEASFKSKVSYNADDSIQIDNVNNKAYLWGNATVKYEDIDLTADYLEIDFALNQVFAKGLPDSTGKIQNHPIFIEKGKEYESEEMRYNFNTKKGIIKKITTQESDGYIHGETIKMASDDVFYIKNGKYTTCEADHPHYYVNAKKLKIINNDKIVTGPAYLAIEDVPTFLAVPFGFFPNKDERSSGIIVPSFGSSPSKGFALENGGYYFGISDQINLKLLGNVYTNGSYTVRAESRYNKRYKRNGGFRLSYTKSNDGERDTEEFQQTSAYFVDWSHVQDSKARPNSDFSALVKFGSTNFYQADFSASDQNYLRNEFSSNITYSQKLRGTPFTFKLNASHNQNNADSSINFTLPEAVLTMSRIYPFKRKDKIGKDKWYEKAGVNYTGRFKNTLSTTTDQLSDPEILKNVKNGVTHQFAASVPLKMGQLNISPGMNYSDNWLFKTTRQTFIPDSEDTIYGGDVIRDTVAGFERFGKFSVNASLNTKLYGIYAFNKGNVKAVRHTITPTVSFAYSPNLSTRHPEYFGEVATDTAGGTSDYTIFDGNVFGAAATPNYNESGTVTFGLQNIVEMKHKSKNDTTDKLTNTTLIEGWNFNTRYDFLAEEYQWSLITMDIRTSLGKFINWRVSTIADLYSLDAEGDRSPVFEYKRTGDAFRLTRATTSIGFKLSGESLSSDEDKKKISEMNAEKSNNGSMYEDDQYIDFNIPWNLRVDYVFTYSKPFEEYDIVNSLQFSGSMNLTPGWQLVLRTTYDFDLNELGRTRIEVHRDLHCWQIDFSMNPFGAQQSYMINIKVKQGFLQDLKMSKNSRWFDG